MAPAWLEELSEDWPSDSPTEPSPPLKNKPDMSKPSDSKPSSPVRTSPSRIPVPLSGMKCAYAGEFKPLTERTANDSNIDAASHAGNRVVSVCTIASNTDSIVHNTVQRGEAPESGDTPEWKRRLLRGERGYGEQRDLFHSAVAEGLENIFKPPLGEPDHEQIRPSIEFDETPNKPAQEEQQLQEESHIGWDTTLPSSPPVYHIRRPAVSKEFEDSLASDFVDHSPSPSPRKPVSSRGTKEPLLPPQPFTQFHMKRPLSKFGVTAFIAAAESANRTTSYLSPAPLDDPATRKTSNQSVVRNETFSPIIVSPTKNGDGNFEFDHIGPPAFDFRQRLESLRLNQFSTQGFISVQNVFDENSRFDVSITSSERFMRNGGFVNTRRGGFSEDGSFRHRMLSPGMGIESSEMLPEESSLQASTPKQFPSVRIDSRPQIPSVNPTQQPPRLDPPVREEEEPSTSPPRSPLKLFSADTYTNRILVRRISQFENDMSSSVNGKSPEAEPSKKNDGKETSEGDATKPRGLPNFGGGDLEGYNFNEESVSPAGLSGEGLARKMPIPRISVEDLRIPRSRTRGHTRGRSMTEKLATVNHEDSPENPLQLTPRRDGSAEGKRLRSSPSKDPTPKRRRTLHKSDIAYGMDEAVGRVRGTHLLTDSVDSERPRNKDAENEENQSLEPEEKAPRKKCPTFDDLLAIDSDGEEWDHSPERSPSSKRDEQDRDQSPDYEGSSSPAATPFRAASAQPNPVSDRKPSIKTQDFLDEAGKIMAMIRNQVRQPSLLDPVSEHASENLEYEDDDSYQSSTKEPFDRPPSRENAAPVMRPGSQKMDPEIANRLRKYQELGDMGEIISSSVRSVSQAHEAIKEAQELQQKLDQQQKEHQDRLEKQKKEEQLKKHQESPPKPATQSQPLRPIKPALGALQSGNFQRRASRFSLADMPVDVAYSDPPNIQITRNPDTGTPSHARVPEPDYSSHGSRASLTTTSSRASDSKKTIAPESVSHLIPDQVGNMYLDHEKKMWVKRKESTSHLHLMTGDSTKMASSWSTTEMSARGSQPAALEGAENLVSSDDNEEDPFASIPDLSVDISAEMQNLKLGTVKASEQEQKFIEVNSSPTKTPIAGKGKGFVTFSPDTAVGDNMSPRAIDELVKLGSRSPSGSLSPERPQLQKPSLRPKISILEITADGPLSDPTKGSVHGKAPQKSTQPLPEEPELPTPKPITVEKTPVHGNNQISHPPLSNSAKKRNAISFSSPIASVIRDVSPTSSDDPRWDLPSAPPNHTSGLDNSTPVTPGSGTKPALKSSLRKTPNSRPTSRKASITRLAFVPRPVSRIDEREEDNSSNGHHYSNALKESVNSYDSAAFDEDKQLTICETSMVEHPSVLAERERERRAGTSSSLSFVLTTPANKNIHRRFGNDSASIARHVGRLSLSPLSEFTMNADESYAMEVSYVVGDCHLKTGDGSKRVMSITVRDLVERLTEAEPSVIFWEDLEDLDLHKNRLSSLHMLDKFCGNLIKLDASNNALTNLDGVPPSLRQLKLSHNSVTEMASWNHLMNLQYLDLSNNDLKSLSALRNLVHIRSIRVDNNQLTSLDGLGHHDGILSIRARGNRITSLDFADCVFQRLEDLDVANNEISEVKRLELLPALSVLKIQGNKLRNFDVSTKVPGLRVLEIGDNELASLNLRYLGGLRVLHADRNYITSLENSHYARNLDSLSLREQRGHEVLDLSFLAHAYEVRKLFLSGNAIDKFAPPVDFLNLQLLELANCGLQELPEHLGQCMPNLRTINVNFNALTDLSPLMFIPRVKRLLAAGNRLSDATAVTGLLTEFPHIARLDLRDNPMTLGFYPPAMHIMSLSRSLPDPFSLPDADLPRDRAFAARLDRLTKLRRRLYWMVLVGCCSRLKVLDGLEFKRAEVMGRDAVAEELVKEGMVPKGMVKWGGMLELEEGTEKLRVTERAEAEKEEASEQWPVEDSFGG